MMQTRHTYGAGDAHIRHQTRQDHRCGVIRDRGGRSRIRPSSARSGDARGSAMAEIIGVVIMVGCVIGILVYLMEGQ